MAEQGFAGRGAVVTGAGAGIGRAIATAFARRGAEVAVVDLHPDRVAETVGAIADGPGRAFAVPGDVRTQAGVERIIEVAFGPNAAFNSQVVSQGAVIATYATPDNEPVLPYWPLAFQNVVIRLLGSDDFPREAKRQAAADLVSCLEAGALRTEIRQIFPLDRIADAHRAVENPAGSGRIVIGII